MWDKITIYDSETNKVMEFGLVNLENDLDTPGLSAELDKRAEQQAQEPDTAKEQQQRDDSEQQGPEQQDDDSEIAAKTKIITGHANRLVVGVKTREQIISSANLFADWIKVDLSKALDCEVSKVPGKLADWMGFPAKTETETAIEEENPEK